MRPAIQLLMAVVVFGFGGVNAWFAVDGIRTGQTYVPKRSGAHRVVTERDSPSVFWGCVSFYALAALGLWGLASWQVLDARAKKSAAPQGPIARERGRSSTAPT